MTVRTWSVILTTINDLMSILWTKTDPDDVFTARIEESPIPRTTMSPSRRRRAGAQQRRFSDG
jgi:hypothetical protein